MSQYNDQYYIIFEKYNEDTLYLAVHDRSEYSKPQQVLQ